MQVLTTLKMKTDQILFLVNDMQHLCTDYSSCVKGIFIHET